MIIKLSQHCILKAYPDSFRSNNYLKINYEKGKLTMEIYSLGSEQGDPNPHRIYKLKGGLMFPIIKNNDNIIKYTLLVNEKWI